MKKVFLFVIAVLITGLLFAQSDSSRTRKVSLKLSSYYISNLNYFGRTDSLKSSGFFPLAELWVNDKFYINAAPVFVNNRVTSFEYAGTVTTLGYQSTSSNKKWFTHLFFTKPFYQSSSKLPQSVLKAQTTLNLTFRNKLVNINTGADLRFSNKVDYGLSGGLDHPFRISLDKGWSLVVNPSAYVYTGTQRFTNSYYKKTTGLLGLPTGTQELVTEEVNRFDILSYEFSMPILLTRGRLLFMVNPAYVLPQNVIQANGTKDNGTHLLYVVAGLKYTIR